MYDYLNKINSPADLKLLAKSELAAVCSELRSFIINEVAQHPGHLGSNLGVIELTVALHYVFDTPYDRIVWDVGHQAYAHKILTGRRDKFSSNRQFGGISGFPSPAESPYDSFGVGHASTSISAGLGMAVASLLKNEENRQVVAVIGDGSMTGGLAFEGLNNTSMNFNNMLIILNDNQMAIDPLKGGITQYLVDITSSKVYNKIRWNVYLFLKKLGLISESGKKRIISLNNTLKAILTKQHNIFEGLNIRYFGPVDGHDVEGLVKILTDIKDFTGPKVLHCITQKGKGYKVAEKEQSIWHSPGKFNVETGMRIGSDEPVDAPPLYQDVFGKTLLELALQNDKIVGITPAMLSGSSMCIMQKVLPARVFDVGIAEGHAVTFSAGLAKEGLLPFCNIYSSFLQRAFDNIIHDVALQNLKVVFCIDRAGIVGTDGATHQGLFDLAYLRMIPNIVVAAPRSEIELRNLMFTAQNYEKGAFAIRYPRGRGNIHDWQHPFAELKIGKGEKLKDGNDLAIISVGTMAHSTAQAIETAEKQNNISIAHFDLRFVKPLDEEMLTEVAMRFKKIIVVEDGVRNGGAGSAILEFYSQNNFEPKVKILAFPNCFVEHGTQAELFHKYGLDSEGIVGAIKKLRNEEMKRIES
ncbi:MAG: 1-deoxy-D-xylulose-5-phosphate synthase [Paludibacter sp.]|jgi:1-deoxy-D-xylulose-5-phosphate synthase|nr:1-deoxy-D-xylulose-5-phosphate synthase [Paludibacter sp.]